MLTKDQITKLPIEDQELVAQIELSRTRHRQTLLKQARGLDWRSRSFPLPFFTALMIFISVYYFNVFDLKGKFYAIYFVLSMAFVSGVIFEISRTNRRLDALLKLLDEEGKLQSGGK